LQKLLEWGYEEPYQIWGQDSKVCLFKSQTIA
jgi:hypothetical protein